MAALKPPTSLAQQLTLLRNRGMILEESFAKQWLTSVSYYRMSGYWYPYCRLQFPHDPKDPVRLDDFETGTSFDEVARLYEFDRKLRTLIHDGIERIEVALRAKVGEQLVTRGALSYKDSSAFRNEFKHAEWLSKAQKRANRAKPRNQSIKHYVSKYSDFPFWVLADVLDFSDLSILFDGLITKDQHTISQSFGLNVNVEQLSSNQKGKYFKQDPFARWCEQLTILRNTCAHHGRVWNKHLTPVSTNAFRTIPELSDLPEGQSDKLFGAILMMSFLIRSISPGTTWPQKVRILIENEYLPLRFRSIKEMGFPSHWQQLSLWGENPL